MDPETQPSQKFLTPEEFAALVGVRRKKLYKMIEQQVFPEDLIARPSTKRIRIARDAVGAYLDNWRLRREYISPAEFAARVGISRESVYRQIGSDAIPDHLIAFLGPRLIRIDASAVTHYLDHWRLKRGAS